LVCDSTISSLLDSVEHNVLLFAVRLKVLFRLSVYYWLIGWFVFLSLHCRLRKFRVFYRFCFFEILFRIIKMIRIIISKSTVAMAAISSSFIITLLF